MRAYTDIPAYLRATGTTQEDLARRVGISRSYLTHLLRGRRRMRLDLALKLADATNVPVEALLITHPDDQSSERVAS